MPAWRISRQSGRKEKGDGMFCPNCGRELRDGEVCGCRNINQGYGFPQPPPVCLAEPPAVEALRKHGSSPLMLMLVLMMGVASLLYLADIMAGDTQSYGGVYDFSRVVSFLFSVLICLGTFLFYASCRRPMGQRISTAGLTVIQVIYSISMSALWFVLLLLLLGLLGGGADLIYDMFYFFSLDQATASGILVAMVTIALVIAVYSIFYFVFLMKTIGALKYTARTGMENRKVSMFIAVMCFISGGFSVFGSFLLGGILSILSGLVHGTISILAGILLVQYRREMISLAVSRAVSSGNPTGQPMGMPQQYTYNSFESSISGANMPQAGAEQAGQIVCRNCGASYPSENGYCPFCGTENKREW